MNTGQIISGLGHIGLIGVAFFGGTFQAEPLPFDVTEVTAISAEEYAALIARDPEPEAVANVDTPEPPHIGQAPDLSSQADDAPDLSQPEVSEAAAPDDAPEITEPAPPDAEVSDEAPVLLPPQEDLAALVPEIGEDAAPQAAPRVAPEPVAQPEPDVKIDDVDQQETAPDESAEQVEETQEETAREEATTEIVTEAERAEEAAPARSLRPKSRPQRSEATQTAETPAQDSSATDDAVAAALNDVQAAEPRAPSGPPLTRGEKDALRVSVQQCWNVGSLSTDALNTTVVVAVSMTEDGRPIINSISMLSSSGGSGAAAKQAFEAARRAIIRCGANGFPLPAEKYGQWQDIEITFNPENMRIK